LRASIAEQGVDIDLPVHGKAVNRDLLAQHPSDGVPCRIGFRLMLEQKDEVRIKGDDL
jgi:hypothetical protein